MHVRCSGSACVRAVTATDPERPRAPLPCHTSTEVRAIPVGRSPGGGITFCLPPARPAPDVARDERVEPVLGGVGTLCHGSGVPPVALTISAVMKDASWEARNT